MSNETQCPSCERDDFPSEHGMKIHHYQTHGESLAKTETECDNCSSTFEILKFRLKNGRGKYCSKECKDTAERHGIEVTCDWCGESMTRQKCRLRDLMFCGNGCRAEYQKDTYRVNRSCKNCGEEFEIVESMLKYQRGEYCSNECYSKDHTHERVCQNCGEQFEIKQSRIEEGGGVFCSMDCQYNEYTGPNHPQWSGGRQYYGPNWSDKRDQILERDNHQCQSCGSDNELHIHHITPLSSFEGYEEANRTDNLITLCAGCHASVERGDMEVKINV